MLRMREVFYIFITCIIALIILELAPSPKFVPHGLFLPAAQNMLSKPIADLKPVSPKDVHISTIAPNTLPIGTVSVLKHVESLSPKATKANQLEIAAAAKRIAAKNGANWLQIIAYQPAMSTDPLNGFLIRFKAYRV